MSPRVKSALLLAATLLIGGVLGALLHARLAERRIERIAFLRSSQGFARYLERAIEPESPEQRAAVRAILDRAAARMGEHVARSRRERRAILDSTRAELRTVLSEEQMARLEARLAPRRPGRSERGEHRRHRDGRPERGPPGE